MNAVTVHLPESLHRRLREAAQAERISVEQFITSAVTEKLSVLETCDLIAMRAARGSREKFLEILASAPAVPPKPGDELPPGYQRIRSIVLQTNNKSGN